MKNTFKKYFFKLAVLATVLFFVAVFWVSGKADEFSRPRFPHADLTITRADGTVLTFKMEIAVGPAQQAYGLMFVKSLADDAGMIFPYVPAQEVAFWMKNTLIPLDMLFVGADGTIGHIVSEAQPLSVMPIPSQIPVIAVVEIPGGVARKDGIDVGDKVNSSAIPLTP